MSGTHENPDPWKMFSEDLEPKGGILSRRKKVRRYFGNMEGVEGIVLRKGGDVGRRGGSGEMVAV